MARIESRLLRETAVQVSCCVGEAGPRFCCPATHFSRDPATGDSLLRPQRDTERDRERHRETHTERDTQRETHRERQTQRETERETQHRETERETHRDTERETQRERHRERHTETHRDTERETHVLGASSHEIKRMRREMCASALTHRAGRCPYTVSSVVYGRKDPLIAVCLSQLKTWWVAWVSSENFRRRIQRAWPRVYARISEAPRNRRWRRTHGPIGGIIATLADHGWDAPQHDRWTSPDGTTFTLSDAALLSEPSPLFLHFEATLWDDFWLAANRVGIVG